MLTSSSLSAFSVTPQMGGPEMVHRARAPGSSREEPPPVAPVAPPSGDPGGISVQPGSRVLPRGSLVDLSV
jgi:hypothetical protein